MLLAIDTSTDTASLALVSDRQILAEMTWHCRQSHTTDLLPRLVWLLDQSGVRLEEICSIVIARGPGSFNGLRVGMSTAKGLALSLGCSIIGISSLEAAAFPFANMGLPVCSVSNAGRGEIAAATYQWKEGAWCQLTAEHITTVEALSSNIFKKTIFCGEFIPAIAGPLREKLGEKAIIVSSPAAALRRAGFLAELGRMRLEAGDVDALATLQPLYLRRPSITTPRSKQKKWI
jgi:tRNA threonylcarbamoyl adenosine modification protein YeaZ